MGSTPVTREIEDAGRLGICAPLSSLLPQLRLPVSPAVTLVGDPYGRWRLVSKETVAVLRRAGAVRGKVGGFILSRGNPSPVLWRNKSSKTPNRPNLWQKYLQRIKLWLRKRRQIRGRRRSAAGMKLESKARKNGSRRFKSVKTASRPMPEQAKFTFVKVADSLLAVVHQKLSVARAARQLPDPVDVVPTTSPGLLAFVDAECRYKLWSAAGRLVTVDDTTIYVAGKIATATVGKCHRLPAYRLEMTSWTINPAVTLIATPETAAAFVHPKAVPSSLWCSNLALMPCMIDCGDVKVPYPKYSLGLLVGIISGSQFCVELPSSVDSEVSRWPNVYQAAHAVLRCDPCGGHPTPNCGALTPLQRMPLPKGREARQSSRLAAVADRV